MCVVIGLTMQWSWWLFLCYFLCAVALTTYWDFLFKEDNLWVHGFFLGLSAFPLCFVGVVWWVMLLRSIFLAIAIGGLNLWINKTQIKYKDWIEELTRGGLIIATLPILLLFHW
jgi:hypothetical protein